MKGGKMQNKLLDTSRVTPDKLPGTIIKSVDKPTKRIMIGIPLTGLVRAEWMISRYAQVIPCNWSQAELFQWLDFYSPLGYSVADARNMCVKTFLEDGYEWLFFIDHDVLLIPGTLLWLNDMMQKGDTPIFGGLYFTKSVPSEPLIYRGKGTGFYPKWKLGDKVWVDGMGLGCHMLHKSILKTVWDNSPEYMINDTKVRQVFETPAKTYYDPEKMTWQNLSGTEDLKFYWRVKDEGFLKKAGWGNLQKKEFPYICDTNIFCRHIDNAGVLFPSCGEEKSFLGKK
jgi:hypothetical protein